MKAALDLAPEGGRRERRATLPKKDKTHTEGTPSDHLQPQPTCLQSPPALPIRGSMHHQAQALTTQSPHLQAFGRSLL